MLKVEDHHHALFIVRLVDARHQRMPVGIDSQHRERQQMVRRVVLPDAGNSHWDAGGALDAPAHELVGFVVGFEAVDAGNYGELRVL